MLVCVDEEEEVTHLFDLRDKLASALSNVEVSTSFLNAHFQTWSATHTSQACSLLANPRYDVSLELGVAVDPLA